MRQIGMRIPREIGAMGLPALTKWAASAGLTSIDLPNAGEEAVSAAKEAGLSIGTIDAHSVSKALSRDEATRADAVASIVDQVDQIADVGGRVMFVCLIPEDKTISRKESFEIFKKAFPPIIERLEARGVHIAMEGYPGPAPHYPTLGCTPEMLRAMFDAIPSMHLGLCYDPSHLVRLGIDHMRFLDEFGDRVRHCHGKDTEILPEGLYLSGNIPATFGARYGWSEGSWRYTVPGQGSVDWTKVALRLEHFGYDGPISIELEDHRYRGSLEKEQQGIVKSYEHLNSVFN